MLDNSDVVHVLPLNDLIEHDESEDCVCGPECEMVIAEDGSIAGWLYSHASLDGRELYENASRN